MIALVMAAALTFPAPPIADAHQGSCIVVIGNPKTGKTSWVLSQVESGLDRAVIFQPYELRAHRARELGELVRTYAARPSQVWSPADVYQEVLAAAAAARPSILDRQQLRLVVNPSTTLGDQALARDFELISELVWRTGGHIDLVCEESGLYGRAAAPMFNRISSGGGNASMRLVVVCQSLMRIQRDVRRHISRIYAWVQSDEDDLVALRKKSGSRDYADAVAVLRRDEGPLVWVQGERWVLPDSLAARVDEYRADQARARKPRRKLKEKTQ